MKEENKWLDDVSLETIIDDFIKSDNQVLFKNQVIRDIKHKMNQQHQKDIEKIEGMLEEVIGNNDVYLLPPGVKRAYGYSGDEKTRVKAMCITKDVNDVLNILKENK